MNGSNERPVGFTKTADIAKAPTDKPLRGADTPEKGVHVDLSEVAQMILRPAGGSRTSGDHQDIDDSALPSAVKEALKRIRELKVQMEQVQREIAAVQSNASLSPDQKNAQLQPLKAQAQSLSAALSSASGALGKLMKEQALSPDQLTTVASLMSA